MGCGVCVHLTGRNVPELSDISEVGEEAEAEGSWTCDHLSKYTKLPPFFSPPGCYLLLLPGPLSLFKRWCFRFGKLTRRLK